MASKMEAGYSKNHFCIYGTIYDVFIDLLLDKEVIKSFHNICSFMKTQDDIQDGGHDKTKHKNTIITVHI